MQVLLALALVLLSAAPLSAQAVKASHVTVELVSDVSVAPRGAPFTVAVRFDLEDQWHTYWRNPGDAGLAPTIELRVPDGYTVEQTDWPFPSVFGDAPDVSYGYHGTVLLPLRITPPAIDAGDSVTIAAKVKWLVCNDVCIADKAELALTIALGDSAVESNHVGWFDEMARSLARKPGKIFMTARRDSAGYELRVASAPERPGVIPEDLHFFP
ncbi:MAG: hypothetical protein H7X80_08025, partial [bacterium]|nr:hypothetical protein [Candidatus Kapabacteria bacterium]